jgi:hypothetical protein
MKVSKSTNNVNFKSLKMKISIELTTEEVKGIKQYLKDTDSEESVKEFIQGIVSGVLQSPHESVSDYIKNCQK